MLSRPFRTVFVHIPKTAGQSVELVFLEAHGLTWENRGELLLRRNDDPAAGPPRLAHLLAREYVELGYLTQREYDVFLSFAIVRNPIDRIVSAYNFRSPQDTGLIDFVETWRNKPGRLSRPLETQAAFVQALDGSMIVDHIVRFEELQHGLRPIFREVFGVEKNLPFRNKSRRVLSARDLTREERRYIIDTYEEDFDLFDYPKNLDPDREGL